MHHWHVRCWRLIGLSKIRSCTFQGGNPGAERASMNAACGGDEFRLVDKRPVGMFRCRCCMLDTVHVRVPLSTPTHRRYLHQWGAACWGERSRTNLQIRKNRFRKRTGHLHLAHPRAYLVLLLRACSWQSGLRRFLPHLRGLLFCACGLLTALDPPRFSQRSTAPHGVCHCSVATTGKWSLGYCPAVANVTISVETLRTGPRISIQSMRTPSAFGPA